MSDILGNLRAMLPRWKKYFVRNSMDISSQIATYLNEKNMSQQDLAIALGKHKSEISKYLSGSHNFTIQTISKIEDVLDKKIIYVPKFLEEDIPMRSIAVAKVQIVAMEASSWVVDSRAKTHALRGVVTYSYCYPAPLSTQFENPITNLEQAKIEC